MPKPICDYCSSKNSCDRTFEDCERKAHEPRIDNESSFEIDKMVIEYKAKMLEKSIKVDDEHEAGFRELMITWKDEVNPEKLIKILWRFIVRYYIARPIAKKVMIDFQEGILKLDGQAKA